MPKILKILIHPNPDLREISQEIAVSAVKQGKYDDFFKDLIYTMKKKDGVGLAAPQVGKKIRVFAVNTHLGPEIVVNPKFFKRSWSKEMGEEGCLSVPNVYGNVLRHRSLFVVYFNAQGEKERKKLNGLMARVFQHEYDHLDGVLFIDKAKDLKKI